MLTGSYDSSVFVWDIGGRKGTVYELNGHRGKVNTVTYVPSAKSLLSTSEDSNLVIWNMTVHRTEVQFFKFRLRSQYFKSFVICFRLQIGLNLMFVNYVTGLFTGILKQCMTKNKLD